MSDAEISLFVGGSWHDFAGFAQAAQDVLGPLVVHHELDGLQRIHSAAVVLYTCLDEHTPLTHGPNELAALTDFVHRGGALVALHSTAVAAKSRPELAALIGGSFVSHPPKCRFAVRPSSEPHAITEGIGEFSVDDELYTLNVEAHVEVLLYAQDGAVTRPIAWTCRPGSGRVVYLALGHDASTWEHACYQRLLRQSLTWALAA